MDTSETEKKKLKEGWIKSWMMIEVLAINEQAAKTSLEKHVEKMEKDRAIEMKLFVAKKDFKGIQKVEKPFKGLEAAYSNVVELEVLTQNFETIIYIAMNYAPSAIEILKPEKYTLGAGEAQAIANSVSEMMHKFAAAGVGGVVINT